MPSSNSPEKSGIQQKPQAPYYSIDWPHFGITPQLRHKVENAITKAVRHDVVADSNGQLPLFKPAQLRRSRERIEFKIPADQIDAAREAIEGILVDAGISIDPRNKVIRISASKDESNPRAAGF